MTTTTLPFHPVFGEALGLRRNGEPIWPIRGAAPDDDKDDKEGSEDDADDSDDDDGEDDSDDADKDDTDADKKEKPDDKKDKGFDWKHQSRANEKKWKASEKKLAAVLKAAGLKDDDGDLTAEQLKEKLEEAGTETKGLRLENAVIKTAAKLGVDADELTDSKRFMSQLDDLIEKDLSSDEVLGEIKKLIDAEVKRRPSLSAKNGGKGGKGGKGGSGSEVGGNGGKTQLTKEDLKKMSPQAIKKAQDEGRLNDLLGITK